MAKDGKTLILIKKEEVVEGGHHGGAWKVAYADFVTAMMAFFLLMWLLNATTEEQRRGIADYFSPHDELGRVTSGFGGPFGGRTANSLGSLASDNGAVQLLNGPPMPRVLMDDDEQGEVRAEAPPVRFQTGGGEHAATGNGKAERAATNPAEGANPAQSANAAQGATMAPSANIAQGAKPEPGAASPARAAAAPTDADVKAELEKREKAAFEHAAQQIRDAVADDPALSDLARQMLIDVTPEGLRIQLADADRQPMFSTGSAALNERARAVLAKIAPVLVRLPEQLSISGHTDSAVYKGGDRSNWDLSAERANATRRLLVDAGLPESRIRSVAGMADRDPLLPADRMAAANRRIAIVVLRGMPGEPPVASK